LIEGSRQHEAFDGFLQTLNPNVPNNSMRKYFGILKGDIVFISHPHAIFLSSAFVAE